MAWSISFAVVCAFLAVQICVSNSTDVVSVGCNMPGVTGEDCNQCFPGYYNLSVSGCQSCDCNQHGSLRTDTCNATTGQCECAMGVMGLKCDMCPSGTIGPSGNLATRCINCFCNGFTEACVSDDGWYQAMVVSSFQSEAEKEGFKTNGRVQPNTTGFYEVQPSKNPDRLIITFPPDYLGDKRTSYSQELQLNLSLPHMNPNDSCEAIVEISSRPHRRRREKLLLPIPPLGTEPQLYKLQLTPGDMITDLLYTSRPASEEDIREILADILEMSLILTFPPNDGAMRRTLRLYELALPYATNSQTDAQEPPEGVSYVEMCTCPDNRMGPNCGLCAPGYTNDPGFGGEFARCVPCFCFFHSDTCNPVTGTCFNCSDNTVGTYCERCAEGYQRSIPLTTAACDECADGYWDAGNGSCIPCNCHPNGSLSLICNKETGVCECREGVTGNQCDTCHENTTRVFPSCDLCDECTTQWQDMITPLQVQVKSTVEFFRTLNLTNITSGDGEVPGLEALFELVEEIKAVLNISQIDLVSREVQSTHALLCNITNQIQLFIERALIVEQQLESQENTTLYIQSEVTRIRELLVVLQSEFENVSQLSNLTFFNASFYLMLTEGALDQSDQAEQIIQVNVSLTHTETQEVLSNFTEKLNESRFVEIQRNNTLRLLFLNDRLSVFEALIAEASVNLCGALSNDSCEECGGLNCTMCGGPSCNSLVTDASEAANISARALRIALDALDRIQNQTQVLESLLRDIDVVRNDSIRAEIFANETLIDAERLLEELQNLTVRVEEELSKSPPNFEEIEERENMTLDIELVGTLEEFQQLLEMINDTIDAFFTSANVSEEDLRRRAQEALDRANRANDLAMEVVTSASELDVQLEQLQSQADEADASVNETERIIASAENKVNRSNLLLDDAEEELNGTRELISNLTSRLPLLQELIEENRRNLEVARNITNEAENIANTAEQDSLQVEETFYDLQNATNAKFQQSEEDLASTLDLQNRTNTLQIMTQQQLLEVENLERVRDSLVQEQEEIRSDIQRIANELERLFEEIQVRIAKNTACLDLGTLN